MPRLYDSHMPFICILLEVFFLFSFKVLFCKNLFPTYFLSFRLELTDQAVVIFLLLFSPFLLSFVVVFILILD